MSDRQTFYERRIGRVLAYVARVVDAPDADLSLDTLAQIAGMSKFHFHRHFAALTGTTVSRLVTAWRLKQASMRLAFAPDDSVSSVAFEAGYGSPEAFARAFRELQGQSPTEFRRAPAWERWASAFRSPLSPQESSMPEFQVEIVHFPETTVAVLEHRGAPTTLMASVARFIEWRKATGLSPAQRQQTFGVVYDDPDAVPPHEFRFDICGGVDGPVPANPWGVRTGAIAGGVCAVTTHRGSTDAIGATVMRLYREWLPTSGRRLRDAPMFFHYKRRMPEVSEPEQETDVYLPIA